MIILSVTLGRARTCLYWQTESAISEWAFHGCAPPSVKMLYDGKRETAVSLLRRYAIGTMTKYSN